MTSPTTTESNRRRVAPSKSESVCLILDNDRPFIEKGAY
jgi:hypothetical protein